MEANITLFKRKDNKLSKALNYPENKIGLRLQ